MAVVVGAGELSKETREFYVRAMDLLDDAKIPFLVGGAYALGRYTGIERHTKDFDIFVMPADCPRILELMHAHDYETELTFPHWLGKVYHNGDFVDVIFSSGNGVASVDDEWFVHAVTGDALGRPAQLIPVEEMIWSKGFVMERERYDGADIHHLLRAQARQLDWKRLLRRFAEHWRVLLAHLALFDYVYPTERENVPSWVMDELLNRARQENHESPPEGSICRGPLLSREQYLVDLRSWGYHDPRLTPVGNMTAKQITHWTQAIGTDHPGPMTGGTPNGSSPATH